MIRLISLSKRMEPKELIGPIFNKHFENRFDEACTLYCIAVGIATIDNSLEVDEVLELSDKISEEVNESNFLRALGLEQNLPLPIFDKDGASIVPWINWGYGKELFQEMNCIIQKYNRKIKIDFLESEQVTFEKVLTFLENNESIIIPCSLWSDKIKGLAHHIIAYKSGKDEITIQDSNRSSYKVTIDQLKSMYTLDGARALVYPRSQTYISVRKKDPIIIIKNN